MLMQQRKPSHVMTSDSEGKGKWVPAQEEPRKVHSPSLDPLGPNFIMERRSPLVGFTPAFGTTVTRRENLQRFACPSTGSVPKHSGSQGLGHPSF